MQAALLDAITAGDLAAVQAALGCGADLNAAGPFARTPLHHAAAKCAKPEIVDWMIDLGAALDARDGDGRTPLHRANSVSIDPLLRHHADVRLVDLEGNTALHVAAEQSPDMCRQLVAAGVAVDARNHAGLTPLHCAVLEGRRPVIELLVGLGANVNAATQTDYRHKWHYIAWDVQGLERSVQAGSTPLSLARQRHRETYWTSGRQYTDIAGYLASKGALAPAGGRRAWIIGCVLLVSIVVAWWFLKTRPA